jgi:carbamoyl-phosphate synthase large subunit
MIDYFKEAVGDKGMIHAANSDYSIAMQFADKSVCVPLIYNSDYIYFLLDYCNRNEIRAIVPLFDIDLTVLSKSKKIFSDHGIEVIVSDYGVIKICNDKWETYRYLKAENIATPKTYIYLDECKNDINSGELEFPLIIKPRWGMGSIGVYQADDQDELNILYKKCKKNIFESYLKYESIDCDNSCVLIQEKIEGMEYGLDVFNDFDGGYLVTVPKWKMGMRAGETDSAEILDNEGLKCLGKKLSEVMRHVGNLDVDCIHSNDKYYVLEMNCRFGGQYPFSHLAGVNFPNAIIAMLKGEEVTENMLKYKAGTVAVKDIIPRKLDDIKRKTC